MSLTKVKDLDKYFKKVKDTLVVTAKSIKVLVPSFYADRGLLSIENETNCLGIVKLIINDRSYSTIMMLSMLTMKPSSTSTLVEDDYEYTVLEFNTNDVFLLNTNIVKIANVAYKVFMSFLALGKIPPFVNYTDIQALFNNDSKLCNINLGINHTIYEVIFAHMYRDPKDPFKFYRHTTMKAAPVIVPLHQISHGPTSSSARMIGSYMADGMVSSLTNDNTEESVIENMMRA